LASNYNKLIENAAFFMAYEKKKKELDQLLQDWEDVQADIDKMN
jgi:ATP-binding cassette subfamily F protein 3